MEERPNIFLGILLSPFALIYRIVVGFRNFMYDYKLLKVHEFDIPIISLGNISAGGTGKTPHTELLIEMLQEKDYKIAVLSRGYKRKTSGYKEVQIEDDYKTVGDEPLQVKMKFPSAVVAVHENRVKGINRLMNDYDDLNVIILDDAFQHRKVKPGLSILLNDFNNSFVHDHMLPFGRLREQASSSHRAHIILVTKCPVNMKPIESRIIIKEIQAMPYQHLFFSSFKYLPPKQVFGNNDMTFEELKNLNVLAVTGIAKTKMFVNNVSAMSKTFTHLKYSDHYNFKKKDIETILNEYEKLDGQKCIIVTEKDAMRLRSFTHISDDIKKNVWFIPIKVYLLCSEEEKKQFDNQIYSYVKHNKRYSKLYKHTNLN